MRFFKIEKNRFKKNYYFCGLKIGSKTDHKKKLLDKIKQLTDAAFSQHDINHSLMLNRDIMQSLSVFNLHQKTFTPFKNIHQGKDVVLVATGSSLNDYVPIENAIHVGVNKAFMYEKILLDYLFIQDNGAFKGCKNAIINYTGNNVKKFFGIPRESPVYWMVSESWSIEANAFRYYTDFVSKQESHFTYDISTSYLGDFCSVVFSAIQFVLWTNPKRIYLVGCDCSTSHFDKTKTIWDLQFLVSTWQKLKEFAALYYPETEIISINPVGLKGMFKDIYTQKEIR